MKEFWHIVPVGSGYTFLCIDEHNNYFLNKKGESVIGGRELIFESEEIAQLYIDKNLNNEQYTPEICWKVVENQNKKVFNNLKNKNIDELAEWLDKNIMFDDAPWFKWWDANYCKECITMKETEGAWCELKGNCKFFKDKKEIPSIKEMIKMWLESEVDEEG